EQFYLIIGLCSALAARLNKTILPSVIGLGIAGLSMNLLIPGGWICGFFLEYWVHFALGSCLYFALCGYNSALTRTRLSILM
ncbi:hypothetical protein ABTM64_21135, partial [Acinetobacter baumannii]